MAFKRKYDSDTELIAVRVPSELHAALKKRALSEGRSKSEVLVRTLETAMPRETADTIFD